MWWKFILEFVFYAADVTNKIVHRPSLTSQKKQMITGDMYIWYSIQIFPLLNLNELESETWKWHFYLKWGAR